MSAAILKPTSVAAKSLQQAADNVADEIVGMRTVFAIPERSDQAKLNGHRWYDAGGAVRTRYLTAPAF